MAPKRGSTIYIPLIVPENWQLASSLVCGLIGFVCLLFALLTSNWNVTTITVPETDMTYPLTTTMKWGLRSIHIKWCITRSYVNTVTGSPAVTSPNTVITSCASEDIVYSSCSGGDGYWCTSAADPFLSYWLIILSCIGLVLSTIFALSRRMFQPVGYSVCVMSCSVAIIIFRGCQVLFEPGSQLNAWMERGTTDTVQGISYFVMTAGTFILLAGMLLASWGTYRVVKRGHETAPSTVDQPTNSTNGPSAAQTENSNAANANANTATMTQFQNSERVLSVIASAPNRVGLDGGAASPSGGLKMAPPVSHADQPPAPPGGIVPISTTTSSAALFGGGANNGGAARRTAIDNDGMDFEALNEPSAVALEAMGGGGGGAAAGGAVSDSDYPPMVPAASPSPPRQDLES